MSNIAIAPTVQTTVVVIGGGIAGTWTALKLIRAGIACLLIDYKATDRGGVLGSTARSVGAVNTSPLERSDFREFMDELGLGQVHPSTVDFLLTYLSDELAELQTYGEFKRIKLGVAVAAGNAGPLLKALHEQFVARGGQILDAWVTRLVVDGTAACGVQYQQGRTVGKVLASAVVIASGGYAGLFDGSVKTNNFGAMLGRFLQAGGIATNLEFVFKHGYGKPDLGALTPTEELPGAEVYDDDKQHVDWLERELYEGRGTANHLEAFKHWRNNKDKNFFIDLKYRDIYAMVRGLNASLSAPDANDETIAAAARPLLDLCPLAEREAFAAMLRKWTGARERIDFDRFASIKPFFRETASGEIFRVRQIAYFSMGGVAHHDCTTNIQNVFVTGEAMHDFGAHRVGGLPWGLYLATGRYISEQIQKLSQMDALPGVNDFDLVACDSRFDRELLQRIRTDLYRYQERDLNIGQATRFIAEMRSARRELINRGHVLDDAIAWTIVAEAVIQASLRRTESRGCFYRSDHPMAIDRMRARFSCTVYDREADVVTSQLIRAANLPQVVLSNGDAAEYRVAVSG
jgi:4-hydroxybenzoate adenylyltransferase